jgi:hypothetical protein
LYCPCLCCLSLCVFVEVNVVCRYFYYLCICLLQLEIQLSREIWVPLTCLTLPHCCVCPKPGAAFPHCCLSQARTCISKRHMSWSFFCVQWFEARDKLSLHKFLLLQWLCKQTSCFFLSMTCYLNLVYYCIQIIAEAIYCISVHINIFCHVLYEFYEHCLKYIHSWIVASILLVP